MFMKNAIIFHGTDGSPYSNWFKWLEGELTEVGYDVWLPELPNWGAPNNTMMLKMVSEKNFMFNEDTILIGHSSGAVALLQLLPKIRIAVKATFLVSAFKDDLGRPNLKGLFDRQFDFKAIKQNGGKITMYQSDDDPYVPVDHANFLAEQLKANLLMMHGKGHFNTENSPDFKEFPALLGAIKSIYED